MSECVELSDYEKVFVGECFAIGVTDSGHVELLVEDDDNYFRATSFSQVWLLEISKLTQEAWTWLNKENKK